MKKHFKLLLSTNPQNKGIYTNIKNLIMKCIEKYLKMSNPNKSITKDRNKDNIKIEILRHTVFSLIMLCVLCISSVVEILISTNFLKKIIKYF